VSYYPKLDRLAGLTKVAGWTGMALLALVLFAMAVNRHHRLHLFDPMFLTRLSMIAVPFATADEFEFVSPIGVVR
jgi:hypothetical protein